MLLPLSHDDTIELGVAGVSAMDTSSGAPLMTPSSLSSTHVSNNGHFSSNSRASNKARRGKGKLASAQVFRTCTTFPEYFSRIVDYRQMDLDATFYQMVTLCVQPSKVYKSAYYRKRMLYFSLLLIPC